MDPEVLVTISLRFPQMDRLALGEHLGALVREALCVGGISTNISFQPYTPEDDEDD